VAGVLVLLARSGLAREGGGARRAGAGAAAGMAGCGVALWPAPPCGWRGRCTEAGACECADGLEVAQFAVQDGAFMCTRVLGLHRSLYVALAAEVTVNFMLRLSLAWVEYRGGRLKLYADVGLTCLSVAIYSLNVAAALRSLDSRLEFEIDRTTFFLFAASGTLIAVEHGVSAWRAVSQVCGW
jgi:hypothetical protein